MPLADKAMALLNPPEIVAEIVDVPLDPCCTVTEPGLAVSAKLGVPLEVTVSETEVDCVTPPPVPVTVIGYVPADVLLPTVSVNVEEPDPGAAMLDGLKPAVTPEGKPPADRAMALLNPPEIVAVIVDAPLDPGCTVTELGLAVSVKLGVPLEVTVSATVVVCVTPPPVPVIVIV
jgi:hypothetical protein